MKEKLDIIIDKVKEETRKECYSFKIIEGKPNITDTKLGGNPYLPKGYCYPIDEKGNPYALLLQINFKDINLEGYPNEGILELFVDSELNYPSKYKILFFDTVEGEVEVNFPKIDLSYFIIKQEYKLSLTKEITYMPFNDYRFDNILSKVAKDECNLTINHLYTIDEDLNDEETFDYLINKMPATYAEIGGYANFTQADPREDTNSDLTECIFKLDSYLDLHKIMIGDCGIAWLLISKENLKNKKFNEAVFDWDCL